MKKIYLFSLLFAVCLTTGFVTGFTDNNVHDQRIKIQQLKQGTTVIPNIFPSAYADGAVLEPAPTVAPELPVEVPKLPGSDDADLSQELPVGDLLKAVTESVTSWKGLGALGIAALVVQLLMLVFRTTLMNWAGKWKLVVVYVLSLAAGYMALMVAGASWSEALLHSQTLAAAQVFVNQLYKQFIKKGDETASA